MRFLLKDALATATKDAFWIDWNKHYRNNFEFEAKDADEARKLISKMQTEDDATALAVICENCEHTQSRGELRNVLKATCPKYEKALWQVDRHGDATFCGPNL